MRCWEHYARFDALVMAPVAMGACLMAYRITDETPYTDPNSRGTGSIVTERKGYILRTRGEHNRMVRHDYVCPVHGVHEHMVSSGDVPNEMPCCFVVTSEPCGSDWRHVICGESSPWRHPTVNQGLSAGSVKS